MFRARRRTRRSLRGTLFCVALLAVAGSTDPTLANPWSFGTNLGISFQNTDGDNATYITLPASAGALQPGLRIGRLFDNRHHEVYGDVGISYVDGDDISNKAFEAIGNYQYNFVEDKTTSYVTGGVGLLVNSTSVGEQDATAAAVALGFGFGYRWEVAHDRGTLRAELRYDLFTQGKDGDVIVIPDGNAVGVKAGFDLWTE